MASPDAHGESSRIAGIYVAALLCALIVLALLGHFGLQDTAITFALAGLTITSFVAAAIAARTMNATEFFVAGRALSAPVNGMAIAAAFMSGGVFLGLAGTFYADNATAIALILGWSVGFFLMAVLVAPFFRRSGACGIAGFLAMRFGGRLIRLLAIAIIVTVLFAGLASAMAMTAFIGRIQLGLGDATTLSITVVIVTIVTLAGGMRSTTAAAVLQYLTLAIAFVVPAALISTTRVSVPIPHLSFGFAEQQADRLAEMAGSDVAAPLAGQLLAFAPSGVLDFAITVVALTAGVTALPHLVIRASTVRDGNVARRSLGWGLIFTLLVILIAPAYAAFTRLGLLSDLAGSRLWDLPAWIVQLSAQGLAQVCGAAVESLSAVLSACPLTDGASTLLKADDVALNTDILVLAWPA
ncbi:MAG: sodium:solute symporter family transporter, partial [Alphaproteobacteria bacterium]